jgi:DNA-binding response OmpR family regulator
MELQVGDCVLSLSQMTYSNGTTEPTFLSPTEMKLLQVLMRNANAAVSREQLVQAVWGIDQIHDMNRVDVYIGRLRKKIEADPSNPRHLRSTRGFGYFFMSEEIASNWELVDLQ